MWKLTIEDDEGKQTSLPLAHDEYGLGRAEDNAIRLTDRNISRKHAILKKNGQGWFVKDLASYNGTYVNGNRVAGEQPVGNADVVQLGDYRLELLDDAALQTADGSAAIPTPVVPVHHRPNRLVVVVGPTPGAEFPLDRDYYTIGRAEDATISINHTSVSRLHAELIALGNGRFEIVDKGSANGIRINGVELKRGILEAGDALELGDVRMRFVGAGKIFRAGVDQSQQLAAVTGFESVAPSVRAPAAAPKGGMGKFVAVGLFLGVGVVAAAFLLTRPAPGGDVAPVGSGVQGAEDVGPRLLKEAQDLAAKGDLDGAHKKLQGVPDDSPVREQKEFAEIEAKWADKLFAEVAAATDPVEKKKLLNQIFVAQTVDMDRRRKASAMLAELGEPQQEPPAPPPRAGGANPAPPSTWSPPATAPHEGTTGGAAPPKTAETVAPPPVDGAALDNASIRKNLMPKLASGKITLPEARMLAAACRSLGDATCKASAQAAIEKLKNK